MASNKNTEDKETEKHLRHVQMILDLKGRIPEKGDLFDKVLVVLPAYKFNREEIVSCQKGGIPKVLDILEQNGDFDIGKYDVIRQMIFNIDKKAVGIINACYKDIKKIDGVIEENIDDSFIDIGSQLKLHVHEAKETCPKFESESDGVPLGMANNVGNITIESSQQRSLSIPIYLYENKRRDKQRRRCTSYQDILPGQYPISNKQDNFLRLSMAIVDLCSDVLRNILHCVCQPVNLIKKIKICDPLTSKLTDKLTKFQQTTIRKAHELKSYKSFDITLLYVMLRIIALQDVRDALETEIDPTMLYQHTMVCGALATDSSTKLSPMELLHVQHVVTSKSYSHLNPPLLHKLYTHLCKNGSVQLLPTRWGGAPYKDSIKLGDDIERIHQIRNNVYGHATSTDISDGNFKIYWNDLGNIMERMDERFDSYYKVNLDSLLFETDEHKGQPDHSEVLHEVNSRHEPQEEMQSILRILCQSLKILKEQMESHNIQVAANQTNCNHQLEIKERERQMQLEIMDKKIELERVKNEQMEKNKITTIQAKHKQQLELKEKERQMQLEMMDKQIELERVKNEQMEKNNIIAKQADNIRQLELKDREKQMQLEMMDKKIKLERVKNDRQNRKSNFSRCKEVYFCLMGFSVGIVSLFTAASVLFSINQL